MNHDYRSPKTLSWLAMAAIALVAVCDLIAGVIGFAQILDPGKTFDLGGTGSSSFWLILQGVLALAQFPVYILSIIFFLVWLYRTYTNLPALRSDSTEFTPGWAVGWWFIPFANLVKPFQAVRSVWAESDPEFDMSGGFLSSMQAGAPTYMGVWWAFWILSNIAANITSRTYDADKISTVELSGYFFIIDGILTAIAAGLAIKVIIDITNRQEQRIRRVGLISINEPPPPPSFSQY